MCPSLEEIQEAQRGSGSIMSQRSSTTNIENQVLQLEYADYYFRITNSEHMTDLKLKFKRICENSEKSMMKTQKRQIHFTKETFLEENLNMRFYSSVSPILDMVVEVPKHGREAIRARSQPESTISHLLLCSNSSLVTSDAHYQLTKLIMGLRPTVRLMMYKKGCFSGGTALCLAKDFTEINSGAHAFFLVCSESQSSSRQSFEHLQAELKNVQASVRQTQTEVDILEYELESRLHVQLAKAHLENHRLQVHKLTLRKHIREIKYDENDCVSLSSSTYSLPTSGSGSRPRLPYTRGLRRKFPLNVIVMAKWLWS